MLSYAAEPPFDRISYLSGKPKLLPLVPMFLKMFFHISASVGIFVELRWFSGKTRVFGFFQIFNQLFAQFPDGPGISRIAGKVVYLVRIIPAVIEFYCWAFGKAEVIKLAQFRIIFTCFYN